MAKKMGASATFLIKRGTTSEENALSIAKLFCNGRQPDITIECSGAESSICTGILVTRSGGCLVLGRDHLSSFCSIGVPAHSEWIIEQCPKKISKIIF